MEEEIIKNIDDTNDYSLYIIIGIVATFLIGLYFLFKKKSSNKKDKILICGPNNTGKTSFFYSLISNKVPLTVSSMNINEYNNFILTSKDESQKEAFTLIDIPGIGYYKNKLLENISTCKLCILFVDSGDKKCLTEVAEYVYDIVNDENFDEESELIIACNKSDNQFSKGKVIIESELNNEVDAKKQIKQKNNLEDQIKTGKIFNLKAKFNFKTYQNIKFIECTKEDNFSTLKALVKERIF